MPKPECWALEPHVCRHCFGRIVSRADGDNRLYCCTNCGAQEHGARVSALCACGAKVKRKGEGMVSLGLKCRENTDRSADFPSVYVAVAVD
jgi:hypothetical protein